MAALLAVAVRHVAASDCEAIGRHLIAQPANTVSSLAYVAVGSLLWARSARVVDGRRVRARTVAAALAAVGLGSVAFHGPGGPLAHWLHDLSVVAVALAVLVPRDGSTRRWMAVATAAAGTAVLLAVLPSAGNALAAPALAAAVLAGLRERDGTWGTGAGGLALLATGFVFGALSRTGEPLCRPAMLLQGHAAWHVLSAAGLGLLAAALDRAPRPGRAPARPALALTPST